MKNKPVLVICRRYNPKYPNKLGGVIVSSENLIKYLSRINAPFEVVDTNKSGRSKVTAFFGILANITSVVLKSKYLIFNANEREITTIGPCIIVIATLFRRKVIFRPFGGNLDLLYQSGLLSKVLIYFMLKFSHLVFLQTNHLKNYFNNHKNIEYFPTCRSRYSDDHSLLLRSRRNQEKSKALKLIFVGHISNRKGVNKILELLREDTEYKIEVDFYGPVVDVALLEEIKTSSARYRGTFEPTDSAEIYSRYDALIFPSSHLGEGYPGAIIESLQAGMPVIASRWRALPELVIPFITGLLFERDDSSSLRDAVDIFGKYKSKFDPFAIRLFGEQFDVDKVHDSFFKRINETI